MHLPTVGSFCVISRILNVLEASRLLSSLMVTRGGGINGILFASAVFFSLQVTHNSSGVCFPLA
jgi:hypothetical protein